MHFFSRDFVGDGCPPPPPPPPPRPHVSNFNQTCTHWGIQPQVSQETLVFPQQAGGGVPTEQTCCFVPYNLMNSVLHF